MCSRTGSSIPPGFLRVTVGQQLRRALEIGKQHGNLLALTLERTPGGENLLCEVPRGVPIWSANFYLWGRWGGPSSNWPHSPQNFCPGGFAVLPQSGHVRASLLPQSPQNFCPTGFSRPQRGHFTARSLVGPPGEAIAREARQRTRCVTKIRSVAGAMALVPHVIGTQSTADIYLGTGVMFWLTLNRFFGSYFIFTVSRR